MTRSIVLVALVLAGCATPGNQLRAEDDQAQFICDDDPQRRYGCGYGSFAEDEQLVGPSYVLACMERAHGKRCVRKRAAEIRRSRLAR